jgi:hypothetical protein
MSNRNPNDQTYDVAKKWLASLGTLCAGAMPLDEAQTRVVAYATILSGQFAPYHFCQASIERAAREFKFFPSFAEVSELLSKWGRDNPPPAHSAIAGPVDPTFRDWSPSDHSWLSFWFEQKAAGFPPGKSPVPRQPGVTSDNAVDHRRAHVASLVQSQSPKAWAHISGGGA